MPFEKGNRANPGGRPKEKAFADAVRVAVNREGADGRKKLFALADKLVEEALNGESWAMQQVADRLDGKPAQSHEHTGNDGGPLQIDRIEHIIVFPEKTDSGGISSSS